MYEEADRKERKSTAGNSRPVINYSKTVVRRDPEREDFVAFLKVVGNLLSSFVTRKRDASSELRSLAPVSSQPRRETGRAGLPDAVNHIYLFPFATLNPIAGAPPLTASNRRLKQKDFGKLRAICRGTSLEVLKKLSSYPTSMFHMSSLMNLASIFPFSMVSGSNDDDAVRRDPSHTTNSQSQAGYFFKLLYKVFFGLKLGRECAIVSLIYLERILALSLLVNQENILDALVTKIEPLLLTCLLLASKMWEDHSVWNYEIVNAFPNHIYSGTMLTSLEGTCLSLLDWNLLISPEDYMQRFKFIKEFAVEKYHDIFNKRLLKYKTYSSFDRSNT